MTLNLTICQPNLVIQASDRRFVDAETRTISTDNANKAIVVGCMDALTSITFCGVGTFRAGGREQRLDHWLAQQMQDSGIPELGAEDAAIFTTERATALFRTFRGEPLEHAFTLAAHGDIVRSWVVSNRSGSSRKGSKVTDAFSIQSSFHPRRGLGMLATGLQLALSRPVRRRMLHKLASCRNVFESEAAIVDGLREAASDPRWSWGIGKDFMVVTLHPGRLARATYFPATGTPHSFGPTVLWKAGGMLALVEDVEVWPSGGYRIAFGNHQHDGFTLAVGQSQGTGGVVPAISQANPLVVQAEVRMANLKYGPADKPGDTSDLIGIVQ